MKERVGMVVRKVHKKGYLLARSTRSIPTDFVEMVLLGNDVDAIIILYGVLWLVRMLQPWCSK